MEKYTKKKKILMVDDDIDLVSAISRIITNGGFEFISAPNSQIGMQKAQTERPDAILIDIIMETYSEGFTFIKNLMLDPLTRDIPRLIFSSLNIQQELDTVLPEDLGTKYIFQKPIEPDILILALKSITKKTS